MGEDRRESWSTRPVARLGAYGLVLAAVLGGGALVGATFGPEPSEDGDAGSSMEHAGGDADVDLPDGLASSRDGFTLEVVTPTLPVAVPADLLFVIRGSNGRPVLDYDLEQDGELHAIIASRDLVTYAHVHPTRDAVGIWRVTVPPLEPGSYRVFADFTPAGGDDLTLGADLAVAGRYEPADLPEPSTTATVDGYDVSFAGELTTGASSTITVTVTRGGTPVTDLEPYLGALGHLVALRDGDLAYLHVHPLEEAERPGGPSVRFAVEVPTSGNYRLFFDFSHGEDVRTAAVTAYAPRVGSDGPSGADSEHGH